MNLVLGLLVGMMIGVGLAFLAEFMDKTVKDEKIHGTDGLGEFGSHFADERRRGRFDKIFTSKRRADAQDKQDSIGGTEHVWIKQKKNQEIGQPTT